MGLTQTDAAVNEERVVRARGRLRDSETGCVRDFVVRAYYERFECIPRIESGDGGAWACVHLGGQRFLHGSRVVRGCLRARCRWSTELYRARSAEGRDDRILQCRHVITLDPKLVDVVRNSKRDRFILC